MKPSWKILTLHSGMCGNINIRSKPAPVYAVMLYGMAGGKVILISDLGTRWKLAASSPSHFIPEK